MSTHGEPPSTLQETLFTPVKPSRVIGIRRARARSCGLAVIFPIARTESWHELIVWHSWWVPDWKTTRDSTHT